MGATVRSTTGFLSALDSAARTGIASRSQNLQEKDFVLRKRKFEHELKLSQSMAPEQLALIKAQRVDMAAGRKNEETRNRTLAMQAQNQANNYKRVEQQATAQQTRNTEAAFNATLKFISDSGKSVALKDLPTFIDSMSSYITPQITSPAQETIWNATKLSLEGRADPISMQSQDVQEMYQAKAQGMGAEFMVDLEGKKHSAAIRLAGAMLGDSQAAEQQIRTAGAKAFMQPAEIEAAVAKLQGGTLAGNYAAVMDIMLAPARAYFGYEAQLGEPTPEGGSPKSDKYKELLSGLSPNN